MLYFFLSYASGEDDTYVRKFFADLGAEVARRVEAEPGGTVGFLDPVGVDATAPWPNDVRTALATCRTFVALCSPKYLLSERCGREWTIFSERLDRYREATGITAPARIPLVWSGSRLHPSLGPAQPTGSTDVRILVRLRSHRDAYREVLRRLADRIVSTAHAHPLPRSAADLDPETAGNAFAQPLRQETQHAPQQVHFVVAAGTRDEMRSVRTDVHYYGDERQDWAPYRPTLGGPLAAHAREVAAEQQLGSDVADLEELRERLARARRNNDIVVLLVDAWVTRLEKYRRTLAEFDRAGDGPVAILVPSSDEDPETADHRGELRSGLIRVLPDATGRRELMFRAAIETLGGFDSDLAVALEEARNKIFSTGHVFRRPAGRLPAPRPILEGP